MKTRGWYNSFFSVKRNIFHTIGIFRLQLAQQMQIRHQFIWLSIFKSFLFFFRIKLKDFSRITFLIIELFHFSRCTLLYLNFRITLRKCLSSTQPPPWGSIPATRLKLSTTKSWTTTLRESSTDSGTQTMTRSVKLTMLSNLKMLTKLWWRKKAFNQKISSTVIISLVSKNDSKQLKASFIWDKNVTQIMTVWLNKDFWNEGYEMRINFTWIECFQYFSQLFLFRHLNFSSFSP